jgi:Activator of Hsp90 ATPase homolog 1-like protein
MSKPSDAERAASATQVGRPPIRQATTVRSDLAHTFDVFVRTIGDWWPTVPFSNGAERVDTVVLEPRIGGRFYERWTDGTECEWGEVLEWDPPHGFATSWLAKGTPTRVHLTFRELGPSLTRVDLVHSGWDALSDQQRREDCALPGGYEGGAYVEGWRRILDSFADRLGGARDEVGEQA